MLMIHYVTKVIHTDGVLLGFNGIILYEGHEKMYLYLSGYTLYSNAEILFSVTQPFQIPYEYFDFA